MRSFAVVVILLAIVVGFTAGGQRPAEQVQTASIDPPPVQPIASPGTLEIDRAANGHFMVEGMANGATLDFIVDTGASHVAIGRADASRLGIIVSGVDFTASARTASGTVAVATRTLPQLGVGTIQLYDVPILILDAPDVPPLLGQSLLARMTRVSIERDRMTLTKL